MTKPTEPYDILPHLKKLNVEVLYGDVWENKDLSKRDRSLVTCAMLAALYRTAELEHHMGRALDNGVTEKEIHALITQVAFYAGWPCAINAGRVAVQVLPHES